jgi:diacylglycerol kinase family enzyme
LAQDLQKLGHPVEIFLSSGQGQIRDRVRGLEDAYHSLCVVGGDGTIGEVVEADPGPSLGIAVCPTGTANVLASELKLPKSPRETAAMIGAGHRVSFDAGRIRSKAGERRFFLCAGLGIDGKIVAEVHAKRGGGTLGKLKYLGPILGSLWNYQKGRHFFVLEDGERLGPFDEVLVTNVAQIGGFWKLPKGIRWDDGLLDVLGFSAGTATSMLGHVVKGMFGGLAEGDNLVCRQVGRVRIETETGGEVQVDGDPGPAVPLEIEVCQGALTFFVPLELRREGGIDD